MKCCISPPSLCKYSRDNAKFKNPKRYAHNALVEFQVCKILSSVNQKKAWKKGLFFTHVFLSPFTYLLLQFISV